MAEASFGLIGPLDIRWSGRAVAVPAARQRILLATLLLSANQPVSKQSLCETVWDVRVSDRAETTLRSYMMRLRRALGPALAGRLSVRPPGYQLRLEQDDELDLLRLQECIRQGRSAARFEDWERSLREFKKGLSLWRGEPLCDVPSDSLHLSVIPTITELRTQLWEGLYAAASRSGHAAEFVVPLQRLTEEDPLNERFSALCMSALAACNRRIDALAEFRRLRAVLISEQGVEPGQATQELHQRLLHDERAPIAATSRPRQSLTAASPIPTPRQLPHGAATFTGRRREADELVRYLSMPLYMEAAPPVATITGIPGIGKSELAISVAHRLTPHYPDGQLYADLRGSTSSPATPGTVIGQFLCALGMDRWATASDAWARVSAYRSVLATRRVLVVLDDAKDADQVRSLIPGSRSCGTLVTGRHGLIHLHEARLHILGKMTEGDACDLLRAMLGAERVGAEPAAVSAIVAACGGMPLALHIAGARLAARPAWPLAYVARLLADERHRLDELSYGPVSVRASLDTAYRVLADSESAGSVTAARAFCMLGQLRSSSFTTGEAAAVFGQSAAEAATTQKTLETLADANLLTSPTPDVYSLHPLMRIFASELPGCR